MPIWGAIDAEAVHGRRVDGPLRALRVAYGHRYKQQPGAAMLRGDGQPLQELHRIRVGERVRQAAGEQHSDRTGSASP